MENTIKVLQITDTHLFADPSQRLLGINTQDSFTAVLQSIAQQSWQPDVILLTGDLSQDESLPAYNRLAEQVAALQAPAYWLPGNHDDYQYMLSELNQLTLRPDKNILINNWQIILLNSQVPTQARGSLAQTELQFLERCLREHRDYHTLVCLHHHPITAGSAWLDLSILQNPAEFLAIITDYPQVKCILHGHIHQEFTGNYNNVPIYATPSTCIQFKPKSRQFALDVIPPGYRYLELHPDGSIKTRVYRAENFADYTDANVQLKGYR